MVVNNVSVAQSFLRLVSLFINNKELVKEWYDICLRIATLDPVEINEDISYDLENDEKLTYYIDSDHLDYQHVISKLLIELDKPISEIAYMCGYNSISHFCKVFKLEVAKE